MPESRGAHVLGVRFVAGSVDDLVGDDLTDRDAFGDRLGSGLVGSDGSLPEIVTTPLRDLADGRP
jgi:hypothetical protein